MTDQSQMANLAGLEQENNRLCQENAALRSRLEPERQKIWVLAYRNSLGDLIADVFTDPNDPRINLTKHEVGVNNYVEIHTSLPIP